MSSIHRYQILNWSFKCSKCIFLLMSLNMCTQKYNTIWDGKYALNKHSWKWVYNYLHRHFHTFLSPGRVRCNIKRTTLSWSTSTKGLVTGAWNNVRSVGKNACSNISCPYLLSYAKVVKNAPSICRRYTSPSIATKTYNGTSKGTFSKMLSRLKCPISVVTFLNLLYNFNWNVLYISKVTEQQYQFYSLFIFVSAVVSYSEI